MKFFNFRIELQNVTEWTESVILNNFSSKTLFETTFRHVFCFSKSDNHRELSIIRGKRLAEMAAWGLRFQLFLSYMATQNILQDWSNLSTFFHHRIKISLLLNSACHKTFADYFWKNFTSHWHFTWQKRSSFHTGGQLP